jgi:cyclic-di-GMP phosphodiesterase, flagellum assembly factor TipF
MVRIGAVFIAICMVLIAASVGAILYLAFAFSVSSAGVAAVGLLAVMMLYNAVTSRLSDRSTVGDQIADLSRGSADLARQVAELGRRLNAVEAKVDKAVDRAHDAVEPVSREIGELGGLVRQIADTVAAHAAALQKQGVVPEAAPPPPAAAPGPLELKESDAVSGARRVQGMGREQIATMIAAAIEDGRIDLYLQPIVTLPQRKVRFYEALSRLRNESGEVIPAGDFIDVAESVGLVPRIDNLLALRCVQVMRRLQLKSRDVGLFCNIGVTTLTDTASFKQFLDFMDANRALASALVFEFSQRAYRGFGPLEHEGLAALAELGFRFSVDRVADLRLEPRELAEHWIRYLKVPAPLLLDPAKTAQSDIRPEDFADLLARSGVDLIAERIENESVVVDLLDYDVRFGQGFLFSAPRPVRAEALHAATGGELAGEAASPFAAAAAGSAG